MSFNKSIQPLTFAWNEKRFIESKSARNAARRSIFRAATVLLNSDLKALDSQNDEIRHEINRCHSDLQKYDDKLQILDNMTQLATQSLEVYFQARMENLRTFVMEQCRIISDGIQEEADHWKEIHAMLQQKLVVPGDLRSYGGGNGLPRAVKQSPNFSRIAEENEEDQEEEEEEEEEKQADVTTLLQSRTLTPLLTQTLKNARLLASKLSQDTSTIIPPQLSTSINLPEETLIEEQPPVSTIPENHVTLRDVSAIEKEIEIDHDIPNPDLSVSLLPYIPTTNHEEEEEEQQQNNKSIASTISDKTFVKTSHKRFSSDEEDTDDDDDDDDEDEDTVIEESLIADNTENARPLLLTADRSIRRPAPTPVRENKQSLSNPPSIKKEKVSFREPLCTEGNRSINKTILLNNNTFDTEKSDYVRPTIVDHYNTSKLPTIASAESNDEEEEDQKQPDITQQAIEEEKQSEVTQHPVEEEKQPEITAQPIEEEKVSENPVVEQVPVPIAVENNPKRRTTRRTTTRLFRESQNDNLPSQAAVEIPTKTRYATRYSTRLATAVIHEESTTITTRRTSTVNRRATRFASE